MTKSSPPFPILLMTRSVGSGGSERQMVTVARSLDPKLFSVHVACFQGGVRAQELQADGIPLVELPVRSFMRPSALQGAYRMASLLRSQQIRLVHAFDVPTNIFAPPVVGLSLHRPCIVLGSARAHRDLLSPRDRKLLQYTDRMVDGIVTNCDFVKQHLIRDEHISGDLIDLCRNGLDQTEFHAENRVKPPEFAGATLVIGVVCVLRPEKDLMTLLDAFARVAVSQPGLALAIVGSGPCGEGLIQHAEKLGISDQCHFVPDQARVARLMRGIDIFVLPSLSEASSNSLLEAMSCGCCPVASRVGGNPELVTESTGLLFKAGDPEDLAVVLQRLIDHPELRQQLARNATEFAARFTVEASGRRMQEIYLKYLQPV